MPKQPCSHLPACSARWMAMMLAPEAGVRRAQNPMKRRIIPIEWRGIVCGAGNRVVRAIFSPTEPRGLAQSGCNRGQRVDCMISKHFVGL